MRRRDALVIGGLFATALAIPPVLRRLPSRFEFEPIKGVDGFRVLRLGSVSGSIDPFAGLDARSDITNADEFGPRENLCVALFGPNAWASGKVPVASFTDVNCPYCREIEADLSVANDSKGTIELLWHDLPLLGPSSVRYARAVLAAKVFDKERSARIALTSTPLPPGPNALRALAERLKIPPEAFQQEVAGARVDEALAAELSLARRLGIFGTPSTVIGRTLVIGTIKTADLAKLIRIEKEEGPFECS